jgi:hypothetical protein
VFSTLLCCRTPLHPLQSLNSPPYEGTELDQGRPRCELPNRTLAVGSGHWKASTAAAVPRHHVASCGLVPRPVDGSVISLASHPLHVRILVIRMCRHTRGPVLSNATGRRFELVCLHSFPLTFVVICAHPGVVAVVRSLHNSSAVFVPYLLSFPYFLSAARGSAVAHRLGRCDQLSLRALSVFSLLSWVWGVLGTLKLL